MHIIESDRALRQLVARETREAIKLYGDARRTLVQEAKKASSEQPVSNDPVTVIISQKGFIRARTGHGHDSALMNFKTGDALLTSIEAHTEDTLIAFGSNGRVYSIAVNTLPSARGDGLPVTSFCDLEAGTEIIGYLAGPASTRVVLANTAGFGLICTIKNLTARVRSGKAFMNLDQNAAMLTPRIAPESMTHLACLSEEGRLLVFELTELRKLADGGKGVTLIDLNRGETLLDVLPVNSDGVVLWGMGRVKAREKTLTRSEWSGFFGRRARKGKSVPVRFDPQQLRYITVNENGEQTVSALEEEPEPTLL